MLLNHILTIYEQYVITLENKENKSPTSKYLLLIFLKINHPHYLYNSILPWESGGILKFSKSIPLKHFK